MKIALPLALATFVVGVIAGIWVGQRRVRAPEPGPSPETRAAAAKASPDGENDLELQRLREETRALRGQLAAAGMPVLPVEEAKKKAAELRKKIPALVAAHDGSALVALMRELAALGEPGYDGALEIAEIVNNDVYGPNDDGENAPNLLGLGSDTWENVFAGWRITPLLAWSLAHPERASAWLRCDAVRALVMDGDSDNSRLFAEALRGEQNPDVATTMATFLDGSPENSALLVECASAHRENADVLPHILVALGDAGTPECALAIEELLGHPDAKIREAAAIEVRAIRPPVAGVYVSQFYNRDPEVPSIRRGDIVVSRNGEPVTSWEEFQSSLNSGPSSATTTLVVHRGNELVTVEMKGPKFVSLGKYVAPGK